MSYNTVKRVVQRQFDRVSPQRAMVMYALAWEARGMVARTTMARLVTITCLPASSIRRALRNLQRAGLVTKTSTRPLAFVITLPPPRRYTRPARP